MAQFSSNELVSLEKNIENITKLKQTSIDDINTVYEIDKCADWIKSNNFRKVCLQFPDFMLPDSGQVASKLEEKIGQVVYIMGDTSYESCCIDYVAAAHVNGDAIIHFGPKCFSLPTGEVPCLWINEKEMINVENLKEAFLKTFSNMEQIILVLDTPYVWHKGLIEGTFKDFCNILIMSVEEEILYSSCKILYIGENNRKLLNFGYKHASMELYYYNPKTVGTTLIINYNEDPRIKKRRNYLIEKIKDSNTIGIVIGTLAIKNYLTIIERIKKLLKINNKRYYVISVGKPTVAKLANFPEIELYVIICCSMNEIFDNRDFYQPLVTPYDIEIALNPNVNGVNFSFDFNSSMQLDSEINESSILENSIKNDVSLLTGKVRNFNKDESRNDGNDSTVALKSEGILALNSNYGAGYLNERTFKGLEQNLGQNDVDLATEGKKGVAQGYENEK